MMVLPLYILAGASVLFTLTGLFTSVQTNRRLVSAALLAALVSLLAGWGQYGTAFDKLYVVDGLSQSLTLVSLLGVLGFVLLGRSSRWEYPLLALYAALGIHMMTATQNLVVMLIALEIFSLPLYVLATWRRDVKGFEAGLKYFLLGALAAAVFLYGIALHFGATGSFEAGAAGKGLLYGTSLVLLLVAFGFKVSLVPFQWWTPDVYQGSPTAVTLLMATAVKAAGFAAMARIFTPQQVEEWGFALAVVVGLTVVFGNLGALAQQEAKRLLAYSSIAHAGYLALALFGPSAGPALSFYLLSYALATGVALAVLATLSNQEVPFERLNGLWKRQPLLGGALVVALLSLAGLPPLAGFWGKYLVFLEAARAGQYALLVLALVTSAIAAYYYLRLLVMVAFGKPQTEAAEPIPALNQVNEQGVAADGQFIQARLGRSGRLALVMASLGVIGLGLVPGVGLQWLSPAAAATPASSVPKLLNLDQVGLQITSPSNDAEVVKGQFSVQGVARPGDFIEIFDTGVKLGETVTGPNGGWLILPDATKLQTGRRNLMAVRSTDGESHTIFLTITAK